MIVNTHYQIERGNDLKYEKLHDDFHIPDNAIVTVKEMGNILEITYNSNRNSRAQIIKLNAEEYYVLKTGEIKQYIKKSENRANNIDSVRKTMKRIKELIQTNVTDISRVRWCTLTYKENMKSTERLYNDFRKFNQRLKTYLKSRKIENVEYIMIAEPQERGAWHCHVIYIFEKKAPYISNNEFSKIWGHGYTKITKLDNVENIAVYLMAYLSDIEIPIEEQERFYKSEVKEVEINGTKKAFLKGMRLSLYPKGMNIIRHSRGIKYPEAKRMRLKDANQLIKGKSLTYHTTYRLSNQNGYTMTIDKKE